MRQYVVDELRPNEVEKIREYLDKYCELSDIESLYWLRMPDDMLTPTQLEHKDCQPHYAAVELGDKRVKIEMLIRSRQIIRCNCVRFATPEQRTFLLAFMDTMLTKTKITV